MTPEQTPDWKSFFPPPYKHYMGAIWVQDEGEHKMLDVRGWGHLTGRGQKRFISDDATAEKVQDEMGNWAANALNACAGMADPAKDIEAMRDAIKEASLQVSAFLGFYSDSLSLPQMRSLSECIDKLQPFLTEPKQ